MSDPVLPFGLGALQSPYDARDWTIDSYFVAAGLTVTASPPASYLVPGPYAGILNQGQTGRCVAFGDSGLKTYEDLRDTGAADLDEARFFFAIGGTDARGAVVRDGLDYLVRVGYPEVGGANAGRHKIAAYYAVSPTKLAIQQAILAAGPVGLSFSWPWSWFSPRSTGVLPAPGALAGGHWLYAVGWDARGLRLRNSWGVNYGLGGDVWMPWAYLGLVREVWKLVDKIEPKPAPGGYLLTFVPYAHVKSANGVTATGTGCISSWKPDTTWGAKKSNAPADIYRVKVPGCSSGSAPLAHCSAGVYVGQWLRIGTGVTVSVS